MNGEFLELWNKFDDRLTKIEEEGQRKHEENLKFFGNLQCDVHGERMKGLAGSINTLRIIIFACFSVVGTLIWWVVYHGK